MAFEEWLEDKIIEIILALLGGGAVYYLFQINRNQKASITNFPSSTIIKPQRALSKRKNKRIKTSKRKIKKRT